MVTKRGVCLIRFDDQYGPGCLYSEGLDASFAEKVSMKSHLSTLSLTDGTEFTSEEFIESVIPFLDEGYVAFSTFFFIEDSTARGGKRTIGIVALVDRTEQMSLYKSIPEISSAMRKIANELTEFGDPKNNLSDQVKSQLNSLLQPSSLPQILIDHTSSTELVKKRIEEQQPLKKQELFRSESSSDTSLLNINKIDFLLTKISADMNKIVHALLKNERILIIGKQEEIMTGLLGLKEFLPHKKVYNNLWSIPLLDAEALFSQSKDRTILHVLAIRNDVFAELIGYDELLLDKSKLEKFITDKMSELNTFPIESKVVIDLSNGFVYGGIANNFCKKIINSIKNTPEEKALNLIQEQIKYLFDRMHHFTDFFLDNHPPAIQDIKQFMESASSGEISLIISILEDTNPQILERIINYFQHHQLSLEIFF